MRLSGPAVVASELDRSVHVPSEQARLSNPRRDVVRDAGRKDELGRLAEELHRVLEDHSMNEGLRMPAPPHFHREARHGNRIARAPVAGAGHQDAIRTVLLDDVDGSLRRNLGLRIQRESRPDSRARGWLRSCAPRRDRRARGSASTRDSRRSTSTEMPRALVLVLEMRRVDEDELPVFGRHLDLFRVGRDLVARHAIQADFADARVPSGVRETQACAAGPAATARDCRTPSGSSRPTRSVECRYCAARRGSKSVSCRK